MAPRVAVVAVFHETNTFSPIPTDWAGFDRVYTGGELVDAFAGTRTVIGGFLDGARDHGLAPQPVFGAFATPAGSVTRTALDRIARAIDEGLRRVGQVDAVFLELHGAMVAQDVPDPEEGLVELVRARVPRVPVAAVLDLHANVARPRLTGVDVLTGYRTNPHVDTYERGLACAGHLSALLSGSVRPYRAHRGVPVIAAPVAQRTDARPLATILARARELDTGLVDVTVHGGYAYADVPHLGMGVTVTADASRADRAEEVADELGRLAWDLREQFRCRGLPTGEAFAEAASRPGLTAVADTGDNINGGAPGDSTWLIHEALRRPDVRTLATMWDPAAVAQASRVGEGQQATLRLGGHSTPVAGGPVEVTGTVQRIAPGRFVNKGPMATGARLDMGTVAVVATPHLTVLVQEHPVQPNDPEMFRSCGLTPESFDVVLLKGAAALRAAWESVATAIVDASTPGVSDSDLSRLDFTLAPADLVR